jgi:hypothetical protein
MMAAPSKYTLWCATNVFLTVLSLVDGDKIMFPNTVEWVLYVISYISLASMAHKGSLAKATSHETHKSASTMLPEQITCA